MRFRLDKLGNLRGRIRKVCGCETDLCFSPTHGAGRSETKQRGNRGTSGSEAKGETNQAIAQRLGITEGAVRYHLKRQAEENNDGRQKLLLIEQLQLVEVIERWWSDKRQSLPQGRPPNIHGLWTHLVDQYGYNGSYKSVRKFACDRFPTPAKRPFRRIETPTAAQMQNDWL